MSLDSAIPPQPMPARVRLLVSGDLHLGRYPSRVPPDDPALSVEAVVRAFVDQAVERAVDAVVLVGDLADEANKHFEAFGVLERTLHRLSDAGVPTYAVAGDHDHDVLGQVVDAVGSPVVHLLGRGETWETVTLEKRGRPVLRLVGWSFAGPHVHEPPVASFPALEAGPPAVGVLHGTIDGTGAHAPTALEDLWETGAAAWLVGSGHAPHVERRAERLVVVPGTPQPLGPEEPGPHHAWLVELGDGDARATPVPLATVRYDALAVDLEGARDADAVRERVGRALRAHAHEVRDASPAVRRSVVRLTLVGETAAYRALGAVADELVASEETRVGGLAVAVDRVEDQARPALDLGRLAQGSGPVATLAALAGRLATGDLEDADLALVRRGVEALQQVRRTRAFEPVARDGRLGDGLEAEAVARLRRQTHRLLDEVLAQRPSDLAAPDLDAPDLDAPDLDAPDLEDASRHAAPGLEASDPGSLGLEGDVAGRDV